MWLCFCAFPNPAWVRLQRNFLCWTKFFYSWMYTRVYAYTIPDKIKGPLHIIIHINTKTSTKPLSKIVELLTFEHCSQNTMYWIIFKYTHSLSILILSVLKNNLYSLMHICIHTYINKQTYTDHLHMHTYIHAIHPHTYSHRYTNILPWHPHKHFQTLTYVLIEPYTKNTMNFFKLSV